MSLLNNDIDLIDILGDARNCVSFFSFYPQMILSDKIFKEIFAYFSLIRLFFKIF